MPLSTYLTRLIWLSVLPLMIFTILLVFEFVRHHQAGARPTTANKPRPSLATSPRQSISI